MSFCHLYVSAAISIHSAAMSELFKSEMLETSFILHKEPYINQVSNVYDMKRSVCFLKRTPNISRFNSSCIIGYIENKILVFTLTMNKKHMSKRVSSKTSFEYTESNPQCDSFTPICRLLNVLERKIFRQKIKMAFVLLHKLLFL